MSKDVQDLCDENGIEVDDDDEKEILSDNSVEQLMQYYGITNITKAHELQNKLNNINDQSTQITTKLPISVSQWTNSDVQLWLSFLPNNLINLKEKLTFYDGKELISLLNTGTSSENEDKLSKIIKNELNKQNFKLLLNKIISNPPDLNTLKNMTSIIHDYQTRLKKLKEINNNLRKKLYNNNNNTNNDDDDNDNVNNDNINVNVSINNHSINNHLKKPKISSPKLASIAALTEVGGIDEDIELCSNVKDEDIQMVMEQANVAKKDALKALENHDSNIVDAILELTMSM